MDSKHKIKTNLTAIVISLNAFLFVDPANAQETTRIYGATDTSQCRVTPSATTFSQLELKCVANIQDGLEYAVYGLGFTQRDAFAFNNTTGRVEPVQSGFGFLYQNQYADHEAARNFCQKYLEDYGCSNIRVEDYTFQGTYLPGYYRSGSNCQVDLSSCTPSSTDMFGNPLPPGQTINICALGLF